MLSKLSRRERERGGAIMKCPVGCTAGMKCTGVCEHEYKKYIFSLTSNQN